MPASIEKSIRKTVFASVFITFITTVIAVLIANENLEKTLLELDFQAEYDLMLEKAQTDEIMVWDNESIKAYYLPDNMAKDAQLPDIFKNIEPPYSGELKINKSTYLVTSSIVKGGRFYLAKNISIFEERERYFHIFLIFLGLSVALISLILVKMASKRFANPIKNLAAEIAQTEPTTNIHHISTNYSEYELQEIAKSFNIFLDELESYIKREQSLIGLASHELRTPIAIIISSIDVIEKKDGPSLRSTGAFNRMRKAAEEMAINIQLILKLSRRQSEFEESTVIDIVSLTEKIINELSIKDNDYSDRIIITNNNALKVKQDPFMIKMLLRNLIQNALNHTEGNILIRLGSNHIEIQDFGQGLPEDYKEYINNPQSNTGKLNNLSGLGLFIVLLICDRISWNIQTINNISKGTTIRIDIDDNQLTTNCLSS